MLVKIFDHEAESVGVFKDSPCEDTVIDGVPRKGWGKAILPLLKSKGVPEEYLEPGDMRCVPIDRQADGVLFLVADPI